MRTTLPIALLLVALCLASEAVQVKEGDFTFSLDAVKMLKDLMDDGPVERKSPRLASTSYAAVCANPGLPEDFRPLCQSRGAGSSLSRLAYVAANADVCEICAFAACTGC